MFLAHNMIGRSLIILAVTTLGASAVVAQSSKVTVHRGSETHTIKGDSQGNARAPKVCEDIGVEFSSEIVGQFDPPAFDVGCVNAVRNAADAMPEGGSLCVRTDGLRVDAPGAVLGEPRDHLRIPGLEVVFRQKDPLIPHVPVPEATSARIDVRRQGASMSLTFIKVGRDVGRQEKQTR